MGDDDNEDYNSDDKSFSKDNTSDLSSCTCDDDTVGDAVDALPGMSQAGHCVSDSERWECGIHLTSSRNVCHFNVISFFIFKQSSRERFG